MGIGLSIVFSGLCALVTDGGSGPGQVVLVDAKTLGTVRGVALPAHAPTLILDLGSLVGPEASGPDRILAGWPGAESVGQVGLWDLTGSEVRIRVEGSDGPSLRLFHSEDGQSSWPDPPRARNDPASWRDLRFLADMASITGDGRINPQLLTDLAGALPRGVAARIHLHAGVVEAGLPSREEYRDDVFEFAANGTRGPLRQALTDTIRWSLESRADAVVIEIAPVSGGPVRRLVLKPSTSAHQAFIGNLPVHDPQAHDAHAMSDEAFAALHFGAYYKLLRNRPADEPLPQVWVPPATRPGTGIVGPVICPPAVFKRD